MEIGEDYSHNNNSQSALAYPMKKTKKSSKDQVRLLIKAPWTIERREKTDIKETVEKQNQGRLTL